MTDQATKRAKRKSQAAEDAEECSLADETAVIKNKKKKRHLQAAEDAEECSVTDEAAVVKKKKKKHLQAAEDAEECSVTDEAAVAKKKKKKNLQAAEDAEECSVTDEGAVAKKKKKKKIQAAEDAEECSLTDEAAVAKKKKNLQADATEKDTEDVCMADETPQQKKKQVLVSPTTASEESLTVFVGGIPWSFDAETLRKDFSECGKVTNVQLLTDRASGKSRGIAFISFENADGVTSALKYDGDDYGGRRLDVRIAEDRAFKGGKDSKSDGKGGKSSGIGTELEVFIKGMPAEMTETSLRKDFEACGEIESIRMPLRGSGLCKGFAWITFATEEGVKAAIALNGKTYDKCSILVERSGQHKVRDEGASHKSKGKGKAKGKGKNSSGFEVFVSNLSFETKEADLKADFLECGEIERMHMPTKGAEGKSMGFAWITYKTKEGLDNALAYDGDDYGGRRLKVEKAGQHGGRKLKDERE